MVREIRRCDAVRGGESGVLQEAYSPQERRDRLVDGRRPRPLLDGDPDQSREDGLRRGLDVGRPVRRGPPAITPLRQEQAVAGDEGRSPSGSRRGRPSVEGARPSRLGTRLLLCGTRSRARAPRRGGEGEDGAGGPRGAVQWDVARDGAGARQAAGSHARNGHRLTFPPPPRSPASAARGLPARVSHSGSSCPGRIGSFASPVLAGRRDQVGRLLGGALMVGAVKVARHPMARHDRGIDHAPALARSRATAARRPFDHRHRVRAHLARGGRGGLGRSPQCSAGPQASEDLGIRCGTSGPRGRASPPRKRSKAALREDLPGGSRHRAARPILLPVSDGTCSAGRSNGVRRRCRRSRFRPHLCRGSASAIGPTWAWLSRGGREGLRPRRSARPSAGSGICRSGWRTGAPPARGSRIEAAGLGSGWWPRARSFFRYHFETPIFTFGDRIQRRIERDRLAALLLDVDLQVVLQVLAHPGEIVAAARRPAAFSSSGVADAPTASEACGEPMAPAERITSRSAWRRSTPFRSGSATTTPARGVPSRMTSKPCSRPCAPSGSAGSSPGAR